MAIHTFSHLFNHMIKKILSLKFNHYQVLPKLNNISANFFYTVTLFSDFFLNPHLKAGVNYLLIYVFLTLTRFFRIKSRALSKPSVM